jgi:hypothetical protein
MPKREILTPQQAFASNAELRPPSGGPFDDNRADNIHSEIKVNGKVIARFYNTGAAEIAREYAFLREELTFKDDKAIGPDLAADRAARMAAALERYGAVDKNDASANPVNANPSSAKAIMEMINADTAMTQEAWFEERVREGRLDPGALFSREV